MRHTLHRDLAVAISIAAAVNAAPVTGAAMDTRGYGSNAFVANFTAVTGAAATIAFEASDEAASGYVAVPAAEMLAPQGYVPVVGQLTFGYIGIKRYVRPVVTPETSFNGTVVAIKGEPLLAPINPAIS